MAKETRKFNGKVFTLFDGKNKKSEATAAASSLRLQGWKVRITFGGGFHSKYKIWIRRK